MYAANVNGNEVSQYTINPITGQLTPKSPATVAAGRGSTEVAVTPNGKNAYATDYNAVSQYSINPTRGNLIPKTPATVTAGRQSEAIAISPNGKYVYVSNCPSCSVVRKGSDHAPPPNPATAGSTIWEYRIDQQTGALTRVGTAATGNGANGIAITPNGKSLYVAVAAIWQYTINPATGQTHPQVASDRRRARQRPRNPGRARRQERLRRHHRQQHDLAVPPQPKNRSAELKASVDRAHRTGSRGDQTRPRRQERLRHQRRRRQALAIQDQPDDRQDHAQITPHNPNSKRLTRPRGHPLTRI